MDSAAATISEADNVQLTRLDKNYHIAQDKKNHIHLLDFLQSNGTDPALHICCQFFYDSDTLI